MADIKKKVLKKLGEVMDPELHIPITDLGLVYEVKVKDDKSVNIKMTLTTIGCPLFSVIEQEIQNKLYQAGIPNVKTELTFDPPWSIEKMSEKARAQLGL
ncbi:DUF59 domain-containing protein [Candidatus Roizmanbacteria bacterium]|nr:DUF59 domain-containing protein [Candidatus Roizmanbacteria bacterium]